MKNIKFLFVGNRRFVLEEMLKQNLNIVKILVIENSYLEEDIKKIDVEYEIINSKKELINLIYEIDFNILVSNGCPFILPISKLSQGNTRKFINIHPSFLPDLRGVDPVPGALLYCRKSGATCHIMNDEIDSGDIIAQVPIEMTVCLDAGLLYQLSFIAEQEVFLKAFKNNFKPIKKQTLSENHVYYTLKDDDLQIDFSEDCQSIIRKIKAFNTKSKGAFFYYKKEKIKVFDAEIVTNPFLVQRITNYKENEVVFNYENRLLIRKGDKFLKLKQLVGDLTLIKANDILDILKEQNLKGYI